MSDHSVRPVTPLDIDAEKLGLVPPVVIEAINEIIAKHYINGRAWFLQEDLVGLLIKKGVDTSMVFAVNWFDVEVLYGQVGWIVTFDMPGRDDDYKAYFLFKRPGSSEV